MTAGDVSTASDWQSIRLVAFDVDGTLYRQRPLRLRMAAELACHTLVERDLRTLRVLARYRRIRERLGHEETTGFEPVLVAETAATTSTSQDRVRTIVTEWIDRRPLRHLAKCRYRGLVELFAGLRAQGKSIGILSDYAATAKLDALGLKADHIVSAEDQAIGVLKPNPKGLIALMRAAGAEPATTVLIGDRPDRDGLAARRAGVRAIIRSPRPLPGWQTFARFDDPLFGPLLVP
jgi:HAD superfamily hydrolase (TIGR01549 family)